MVDLRVGRLCRTLPDAAEHWLPLPGIGYRWRALADFDRLWRVLMSSDGRWQNIAWPLFCVY
jgi:hypothetical protein